MAAYTRSPWPHCPMMKYIGTSTISKQMKKRKRSSERNVPMHPASSRSIHAAYAFSLPCASTPNSAIGNKTPVSTTRNSEMPSTPRCHEIPNDGIHSCMVTNWKPPLLRSNATSRAMLNAPVSVAATRAKTLMISGRRDGSSATITAEIAGSSTSEVRIGKSIRRSPVRRTTRGAARPRPRSRARSCARTPTAACGADGRRRARAPRRR